ncbi:MAG: SHOCT domain-containing protein [Patescibacteria group bacterium]
MLLNIFTSITYAHTENDYFGHHMFSSMNWGIGGIIIMGFFWLFIIGGAIYLVWHLTKNQKQESSPERAFDILKERYAKGEIGKKEFEEKKKDLNK